MKIKAQRIIGKIKADLDATSRGRISLYINRKTAKAFMAACKREDLSASIVVEELMEEFLRSAK